MSQYMLSDKVLTFIASCNLLQLFDLLLLLCNELFQGVNAVVRRSKLTLRFLIALLAYDGEVLTLV